jgi:peptidyl-prolyl cis-trans isomerase SurA
MKRYLLFLSFAAFIGPARATTIELDGLAATVNNRVITVGEVLAAVRPAEARLRLRYAGLELRAELEATYDRTLQSMIDHNLMLEEWDSRGRELPKPLIDERTQRIIASNFGGNRAEFLDTLTAQGITQEEWREQMREMIIIDFLRAEMVSPLVVISPRQIRAAYEARLEEFRVVGATRARIITVPAIPTTTIADPLALMTELHERLRAGESFAELAEAFSQDAAATRGGNRGWIQPGDFRAELAQPLRDLEPGTFSEVIETDDNLYLIKVDERRADRIIPFAEVRDQLADEVRRAEEERIQRAWLNRLQQRFHVQRYDIPAAELNRR